MKRIFSSLAVSVLFLMVVSASAADKATVNGWVSDTQCGAKGASAEHVACTKKCLGKGAKLAVVTDGDKKVLTVDNPEALKGHEGHHVAVTGDVTGDTIHVDSATML
jgi:type IV secretory pathway TrbL component